MSCFEMSSVDQLNDILLDDSFLKLIEEYSIYFNPASRLDDHDTHTVDLDVEKVNYVIIFIQYSL